MASKKKSAKQNEPIDVARIKSGRIRFHIRGLSPLIYNAMSAKAKMELMYPKGRKSAAEKASRPKHHPVKEYQASAYRWDAPETLFCLPAVMFKRALASAALDLEGCNKAQLERLTWAVGDKVPTWGVPELKMDVVRSANMNKTPDIRSRAILREWACVVDIEYVRPIVNEMTVANLLAAAGMIRGVGDYRQQKGAGNYGQFVLVDESDDDWQRIVKTGGRAAQEAAYEEPVCYDVETEELLAWWHEEYVRRGHDRNEDRANGKGARA